VKSKHPERSDIHVYPMHDRAPHDTYSRLCPCRPRIQREKNGVVVIHRSWDGREILECAVYHAYGPGKT
jgi:hypothetical protein